MGIRLFAVLKARLHNVGLFDSVSCRCERIARAIGVREIKETVMAKVIEFYIPTCFRRRFRVASQVQCGKVIEFCLATKKSA
jgi:hypothetical protein